LNSVSKVLGRNLNGLLVLIGLGLLLSGIRQWSPPAALVVGGLFAIAIGLRPYLRAKRNP
jgi:hypothetical protein